LENFVPRCDQWIPLSQFSWSNSQRNLGRILARHGVDDVSPVERLPCTERLGKRGHVDHWQSALPPSLSEATHGRWHEMSNGLLSLENISQRDK
jgi:hypothetical protein